MRVLIRRLGNSQGVTIPKRVLDDAGLAVDTAVEMSVDGETIVLRKVVSDRRAGWADDAALAAADGIDPQWLVADLDANARAGSRSTPSSARKFRKRARVS